MYLIEKCMAQKLQKLQKAIKNFASCHCRIWLHLIWLSNVSIAFKYMTLFKGYFWHFIRFFEEEYIRSFTDFKYNFEGMWWWVLINENKLLIWNWTDKLIIESIYNLWLPMTNLVLKIGRYTAQFYWKEENVSLFKSYFFWIVFVEDFFVWNSNQVSRGKRRRRAVAA